MRLPLHTMMLASGALILTNLLGCLDAGDQNDTGTTPDDTGTMPDGTMPDDTGTMPDGTTPDGTTPDDTGTTPDGTTPEDIVTWHRDIAPMLETHCGACHIPGGQGTGDFTDRNLVTQAAPALISAVDAGRMPPPASDPDCHPYVGDDRWVVPDDFTSKLQEWIDEGSPEGDPADAVEVPPFESSLADPDLELRLPQSYDPQFADPDNPGNEYRCFVLEHGRQDTFYINALAPIIDQSELVHHIVLFKVHKDDVTEAQRDPNGFDCIDMTFFAGDANATGDAGMMSAWAPGSQAVRFGESTGIRMDPHHVLVAQMQYYDGAPSSPDLADRSGYGFEITDSVDTEIIMAPFGPNGFRIPAGAESHAESDEIVLPIQLRLHGVMPHMHYLGQSYHMWFEKDGQESCIVRSERYDFDNQLTYMFEEPITIPSSSTVGFGCTWNNSTSNPNLVVNPPVDVGYGERTDEEMCYGFSLLSVR